MEWVIGVSAILSSGTIAIVVTLWRRIHRMRENEYKHLEKRLNAIEKMIHEHIQWHLTKATD